MSHGVYGQLACTVYMVANLCNRENSARVQTAEQEALLMEVALIKLPTSYSYLILWVVLFTIQTSQGEDKMELGSVVTPSSTPLRSPSSAFVFSFRPPPAASSSTNLYLAISFAVQGPPAWVANRNNPVSSGARLTLSSNGDLSLLDPSISSDPIWSSQTSNLGVVQLQLLDSGNLVLLDNKSDYVWQSFLSPTDTLLPTQNFTNKSSNLASSERAGLFNSGSYTLSFSSTGVLQLSSVSQPAGYWSEWGEIPSFWYDFVGSNIAMHSSPSTIVQTLASVVNGSSSIFRLTLDVDGNLRMYTWDITSAEWKSIWMAFTDVCSRVLGLCGEYGVCMYNSQPTCFCPQGFTVKDSTLLSSGCVPNYAISPDCTSTPIKYAEIESVDFPFNDLSNITDLSTEECKDRCLQLCSCKAAVYWQSGDYGHCWLKKAVQNGLYENSQKHIVFLKMSALDPSVFTSIEDTATNWSSQSLFQSVFLNTTTNATSIQTGYKAITVIALSTVVGAQALCFAAVCMALLKSRKKLKYTRLHGDLEAVSRSPLAFSYQEIEAATENFSHKLGAGGFGTVYKGKLLNDTLVAVKQLEGISQQEKQFQAEIATLGHIHHINLLRLVGFCSEGTHRLLVYEFMENGSLDQILFPEGTNAAQLNALDWGTRFQICLGVARGVHYLHEECLECILHCDIKPQNILLDSSFTAKVADFGLAYLYSRDHTVKMTTIRGTRGYLAPEWVLNLPITVKADVFSYGMLVMEIVSGRKNYMNTESALMDTNDRWCFPVWAYGKKVEEVIDSRMNPASIDYHQAELVMKVAFACTQGDRNARPSMGRVVQMLEGMLPIPETPPPSLFPHDNHALSSSDARSSKASSSKAPFSSYKASGTSSSSLSSIADNLYSLPVTSI